MSIPSIDYLNEFQGKLGDAIAQALDLGDPLIGGLKAMEIYPPEMQVAAALAGQSLQLPAEITICYLFALEGILFAQNNSTMNLVFSRKKRELNLMHQKLMLFAKPITGAIPDNKELFGKFVKNMCEDLGHVLRGARR